MTQELSLEGFMDASWKRIRRAEEKRSRDLQRFLDESNRRIVKANREQEKRHAQTP